MFHWVNVFLYKFLFVRWGYFYIGCVVINKNEIIATKHNKYLQFYLYHQIGSYISELDGFATLSNLGG